MNRRFIQAGIIATGISLAITASQPATARSPRSEALLDDSWRFTLTPDSGADIRPFEAIVDLPHDWSIGFPFDRKAPAGNDGGYLPTGKGTYTKSLRLTEKDITGKRHSLLFEGVYERWTLKVNGHTVGYRPYGYSSVIYDITPYLHPGDNTIEVVADNSQQINSRWYTGSGIYRHVRHITTGQTFIKPWTAVVTTPEVSRDKATVDVSFAIEGDADRNPLTAVISVKDAKGKVVADKKIDAKIGNNSTSLTVSDPLLWSPDTPDLYIMQISISSDGKGIDEIQETFGIRKVEISADGILLNGKPILLNGGCVHHDNGILGAASYDAAEARKVRLMKEAGFNAVRTSHNPPSPAFLDECDRQGLLVIDEVFDGWRDAKTNNDYSREFDDWALKDVEAMVVRDRNHPSIIAWSIGNEVIERKKIEVVTTARALAGECRRLDPTRPVTSALCAWDSDWEIYDPLAEALDITGYNYMIHKSETDHERCPERVMWQTESYPADAFANWKKVSENPYIIGDFVWTAIDYLGESGIGRYHYAGQTEGEHYQRPQWPWHGAYCGDIDITGLRKPISHYRDFLYNPERMLYMAVREPDGYYGEVKTTQWGVWPTWESWNWNGHEGKPIEVEVISRYPSVRLYLDDVLVGEKNPSEAEGWKCVFPVAYAPGRLKAVGIGADGREMEESIIETAGKPAGIILTPDKTSLSADNQDISFVTVEIVDDKGRSVPDVSVPLEFTVAGPGEILASGSADMTSKDSYRSSNTTAWKGRAIVALKSGHKPGKITLTATSPGLKKTAVSIQSR